MIKKNEEDYSFQEYARAAMTLITPGVRKLIDEGEDYLGLGLIGETGEVAEHVKKCLRDDEGRLTDERREKLIKELGDVLWYAAVTAHHDGEVLDLDTYGVETPVDAVKRLARVAASEDHDRAHQVLRPLSALARWCGVSLRTVARLNIEKLNDRRDRGVLHGSGDAR